MREKDVVSISVYSEYEFHSLKSDSFLPLSRAIIYLFFIAARPIMHFGNVASVFSNRWSVLTHFRVSLLAFPLDANCPMPSVPDRFAFLSV